MKKILYLVLLFSLMHLQKVNAQTPSVSGPNTFGINTSLDKQTIYVPLKFTGKGKVDFTNGTPAMVRNGSYSDSILSSGINALGYTAGLGLKLEVETKKLRLPGDYNINIAYISGGDNSLLDLVLHREPAVITPTTVKVTISGSSVSSDQLYLKETGNKGGAANVLVSNPFVPAIKAGELIRFDKTPKNIAPAGQLSYQLNITDSLIGELPLGTTKTSATVTGDGLTAPVSVEIDILNKRSLWWIPAVTILGLLTGFLTRIVLQGRRDYEQARMNGLDLLRQIWTFSHAVQDKGFQTVVAALADDLQLAINVPFNVFKTSGLNTLNNAIATATEDYNKQKDDLGNRLAEAKQNFDVLKTGLFGGDHEKVVMDRFGSALETLQRAAKKLELSDASGAASLIDAATKDIKSGLKDWALYTKSAVDFLSTQALYMPATVTGTILTEITTKTGQMSTAFQQIMLPVTDPVAFTGQADLIQEQLQDLIIVIDKGVTAWFKNNAAAAANPAFKDAYAHWMAALTDMATNPQMVGDIAAYWDDNLKTNLESTWTDAVNAAANTRLGGARVTNHAAPAYQLSARVQAFAGAKSVVNFDFSMRQLTRITRAFGVASTVYETATLVQTAIVALIIIIGLFAGYYQNFTGTWSEMINLFLFAFSLNVTVQNLNQFGGKSALL